MADDSLIAVQENAPIHPLQQNWRSGPKGAYEVKKVEDEMYYIRVDMPGAAVVIVKKEGSNLITLQGETRFRFYECFIIVQCADIDQVHWDILVKDGAVRLVLKGVTAASLHFRMPETDPQPVNARQYHLGPESVQIEGMRMTVQHGSDCRCCHGSETDNILNGPWSENTGCINPFVKSGLKGVFHTVFNPMNDASGDIYMHFRLDMPDCLPNCHRIDLEEKIVVVSAQNDQTVADFRLDEPGGRSYFCRITLLCECCFFDTMHPFNATTFVDGVLRVEVKVRRTTSNVIKDEGPSDRNGLPPSDSGKPSVSPSTEIEALGRGCGRGRGRNHS